MEIVIQIFYFRKICCEEKEKEKLVVKGRDREFKRRLERIIKQRS